MSMNTVPAIPVDGVRVEVLVAMPVRSRFFHWSEILKDSRKRLINNGPGSRVR